MRVPGHRRYGAFTYGVSPIEVTYGISPAMFGGVGMPIGQKVDTEVLRKRRLAARKLLEDGIPQAEVARRLKFSRQSVSRRAETPKR